MADLLKRFEQWSGRWRAIAIFLIVFTFFHAAVMLVINQDSGESIGIVLLLSLMAVIVIAVKYFVLGFISLPVYTNQHALALSFAVCLGTAVFTDVAMYTLEALSLDSNIILGYRTYAFLIAGLLGLAFVVLYLVFNHDDKRR